MSEIGDSMWRQPRPSSPQQMSLPERRLRRRLATKSGLQAVPSRVGQGPWTLSWAQERLWFLERLEPGRAIHNRPAAFRLVGPLDVRILEQTLSEIVRRHQVLRTTFPTVDNLPVQVIAAAWPVTLPVTDLSELPVEDRANQAVEIATAEGHKAFDLARGPLLRARLLRLTEGEHILVITLHHTVFDAWSMIILGREMGVLYEAYSNGRSSPLAELPIQYADYAVWQRQQLQGEVLQEHLSYWKEQLAGVLPVLDLPSHHPWSAAQGIHGAEQSLRLSDDLTKSLRALSRREGVTLFMALLAVFQMLLHRYTGQDDIIVGAPVATRTRIEMEGLIGCFVNTLVLRVDFSGDLTFHELLARVRKVALEAYAHQDVPFEKLVQELQPERSLSRNPLFNILFNYTSTASDSLYHDGINISSVNLAEPQARFPLACFVVEQGSELDIRLVFPSEVFSAQRMACLLDQFHYLLEQVVVAPGSPIRSYSLVTPRARSLLPDARLPLPEPLYEPAPEMFRVGASQEPERVAIRQGKRTWTFGELAARVDTLARTLLHQGLERGDVIAVLGSRSFGLIASMLAVLEGGGVLLLVDPNLPHERLQLMLRESRATRLLVVGSRHLNAEWTEHVNLPQLQVGPNGGQPEAPPGSSTQAYDGSLSEIKPDDAAYIFFTSGTTGVPKGVLGSHKGLSHFLHWQRNTFQIGPDDRCAQLAALSFDPVVRDVYLPLVCGATLCLPDTSEALAPHRIVPWLEREGITVLHTVPSVAQSWLRRCPPDASLPALRWVFFGGEALPEPLVRQWREAFPDSGEQVNLYGATETTLSKCYYCLPADIPHGIQPLGRPLPDTQALILGEHGQLCGIGEVGEIVLRTPFRSLGYINAPQESQDRFVQNPFRDDRSDLLYHTGDRGRFRPDGSLEFAGRIDHQVKIRGVRIEPGEIETVLSQQPDVRQVTVIAREDIPGEKRLVAYVVLQQEDAATTSELHRFLRQKLPEYMVPAAFVTLKALPLTPSGKVDRQALPAPKAAVPEMLDTYVAPRTAAEERLTSIWAQVLGLNQVSIHDSFFYLGGHSLLATELISRIREVFDVGLPIRSLFEAPTVEQMAHILEQGGRPALRSPLVPIQTGGSKPPFFVTGAAIGLRDLARHLGPDQPFYGLQRSGLEEKTIYVGRIEGVATDYVREMRAVQPEGPYFLGGHLCTSMVVFEMAQQLLAQGEEVGLLALLDPNPPNRNTVRYFPKKVRYHLGQLSRLKPWRKPDYVAAKVRSAIVLVSLQLTRRFLKFPLGRRLRRVVQDIEYVPKQYSGKIVLFRGAGQLSWVYEDPFMGWGGLAAEGLEVHEIPGGRLLSERQLSALVERLRVCLFSAQSGALEERG